jgi:hypothetical protein
MTRSIFAASFTVVLLSVTPYGTVDAMNIPANVDGGPPGMQGSTVPDTPVAQPIFVSRAPEPAHWSPAAPPTVPERPGPDSKSSPVTGSALLGALDSDQMANARISLEPMGDPSAAQLTVAGRAERLWNEGRYAESIGQLERLESSGQNFAVLISWKQPIEVDSPKVYADVRISTRTDGVDIALDYHPRTGNIFVLVVWTSGWSLHMSTDLGATWSETYFWGGFTAIGDMAVSGDNVWVGYSSDGDLFGTSRFRRFSADTGLEDATYGFHVVGDEGPNTITEIEVVANTPDINNRIYMAYLVDETNSVSFWWSYPEGLAFHEIPTAITDAVTGLDLAWNPSAPSNYKRWLSYLGTDDRVHLVRSDGDVWQPEASYAYSGITSRTALSAYADHVFCAFECESAPGKIGVCYLTSQDAGVGLWLYDDAYWPTGDEVSGYAPDFSVRSGVGAAAVFSSETGAIDDVYFTTSRGWSTGIWTTPEWYNTYDHVSGADTYIEWIGSLCVGSYGMIYFDGEGDQSPYFDLMTPRSFFCDGFESGDTGSWD